MSNKCVAQKKPNVFRCGRSLKSIGLQCQDAHGDVVYHRAAATWQKHCVAIVLWLAAVRKNNDATLAALLVQIIYV